MNDCLELSNDIEKLCLDDIQQNFQSADPNKSLVLISVFLQKNVSNGNLSKEEKLQIIHQLIRLLLNSKIDSNLKKGALKCITTTVRKEWYSEIIQEISSYLSEIASDIPNDVCESIHRVLENISVLISRSPIFEEFFKSNFSHISFLCESMIENLLDQISHEPIKVKEVQIAKTLHFLSQTLIVFVDESCKRKTSVGFSHSLYKSISDLMSCRKLCINTIYNCGLLVVTLDFNFFEVSSNLELLKQLSKSSPIECLAICHGYLASPSLQYFIVQSSNHCNLIVLILDTIWSIYTKHVNDSLVVISVLKIALLLSKKVAFEKHEIPNESVQHLIHLLLSHLDHFLNSAKNLSKEALIQLIRQQVQFVISEVLHFVKNVRRIERKICIVLTALSTVVPYSSITKVYANVLEDLLDAAKNSIYSSYVCQAYVSLMLSNYQSESVDSWFDMWIKPLLSKNDEYNLLLEEVLVSASKLSPEVFQKILMFCRLTNETNYSVFVKCLLEIKANTSSSLTELSNFSDLNSNLSYWRGLLPFKMMQESICVPNSMNALKTANLLIESSKSKEVLTYDEITLMKLFIDSQIASEKSDFRYKVLNLLTQLFNKISTCYHHSINGDEKSQYSDFIEWTVSFCINNIFPGASYERRLTALKILKIIIDTNLWPDSKIEVQIMEIFFNCLNDPFEDNKEIAKSILISIFIPRKEFVNDPFKVTLFHELCQMTGSIRFSDHNTAAYFFEILCCCTPSVNYFSDIITKVELNHLIKDVKDKELWEEDCYFIHLQVLIAYLKSQLCILKNENIVKYPLHGYLHVIRHLIGRLPMRNQGAFDIVQWKKLINEITKLLISCNTFAVSIVSHSSPEGYLPEDGTIVTEENTQNAAQHLLSCNWRTVKEASLLLGHFAEKFSICDTESEAGYLDKNTFLEIGNHLKSLIYIIRHKGSFKQVYVALFQYCKRCWRTPDREINSLPKQWLKEILNEILYNGKQLCVTRRGAGIPCIVLAILCTEFEDQHKYKSSLLNAFMESIFEILNKTEIEIESKVHALNILCDLFKHKDMAEEINNFIERAIIIALNGFKSNFWNERNTSNLLLSSMLIRIFGVPRLRNEISWKNKMTGKMFFQKYPLLFDIFLNHLRQNEGENISVQSALYPILLIFARLYPSYHDEWNDTFQLNEFIPFIYNCSQNSIYKIRQLTVQAIVPFMARENYVEHIYKIWSHLTLPLSENTKHGLLLQFDGLLQHMPELVAKDEHKLLLIFTKILLEADVIVQKNHSFVLKEKMLIILSKILQTHFHLIDMTKFINFPINENDIRIVDRCHLNEQNYIIALKTFNVGLQYLTLINTDNSEKFVSLLENMIDGRRAEESSNIALEFIMRILLEDGWKSKNVILNNLTLNNVKKTDAKEIISRSKTIYGHLLNRLKDTKNNRLYETLLILPEFLKNISPDKPLIETFLKFCKRYYNNTNLMIPFLTCMDIVLEKLNYWEKECLAIMRLLLSTGRKPVLQYQQKLRIFFFKYYNFHSSNNDEDFILNAWTFVGANLLSLKEEESIYFKNLMRDSTYEDHMVLNKFIQAFCNTLRSTPLLCAVGLMSWIIKDMGPIFNEDEKNNVFFGDLPEYFEDQFVMCKLSQEYLNRLLKCFPSLWTDELTETQLLWLLEQSGFRKEEFIVSSLNDFVSVILQKFKTIKLRSSCCSFIKNETVEEQIIFSKLPFLYSLPKS